MRYSRSVWASRSRLAITVALLALPLVVLPAAPAMAAGTKLCEENAPWCVGGSDLSLYAPLVETEIGRNITFSPFQGGYLLSIDAAPPGECVAAANNGMDVVIHPCSGAGTLWFLADVDSTGVYFKLRNQKFPNKYLAGAGVGGAPYQLKVDGLKNVFYRFFIGTRV